MTETDMLKRQAEDLKKAQALAPDALHRLKKAAEAAKAAVPKPAAGKG